MAEPEKHSFNKATDAQGVRLLTADKLLHPLFNERDKDGRWIVKYYFAGPKDKPTKPVNIFEPDKYEPLSPAQRKAAEHAFGRISGVCNITFVQVDKPEAADIRFFAAHFYGPENGVLCISGPPHDLLIANSNNNALSHIKNTFTDKYYEIGKGGYGVMLHEILHGIGFSHPDNKTFQGNRYLRNADGTIMSYIDDGKSATNDLGKYDIIALQYVYGERTETHNAHPSGLPQMKAPHSVPRCTR